MKEIARVFALWATAGAGVVLGMKAGETIGQKLFKEKPAEKEKPFVVE